MPTANQLIRRDAASFKLIDDYGLQILPPYTNGRGIWVVYSAEDPRIAGHNANLRVAIDNCVALLKMKSAVHE